MGGVTITELIDKMGLRNMTPELETDNVMLVHADVNRPALQLTGFFDHFDKDRVQIIGYVENAYISTLTPQRRREMFDKLLSSGIPCLDCRGADGIPVRARLFHRSPSASRKFVGAAVLSDGQEDSG